LRGVAAAEIASAGNQWKNCQRESENPQVAQH
jgi:hypothetical protein